MSKVICFDLDDTLYPESTFVYSGFSAVAKYLSRKYKLSKDVVFENLCETLREKGRGAVFDQVLTRFSIHSVKLVKECVVAYRLHKPCLRLPEESRFVLENLRDKNKYLVTDGNINVQQSKIDALGVACYFRKIYITRRYGLKYEKPSLHCFSKILDLNPSSGWQDLVYIGDNPEKDFHSLKRVGAVTVRVNQGMYAGQIFPDEMEANYKVSCLSDALALLKKI